MVLRGSSEGRGLEAWQKLHRKYNPKTMARGVRLMAEVSHPGQAKDIKDAKTSSDWWMNEISGGGLEVLNRTMDLLNSPPDLFEAGFVAKAVPCGDGAARWFSASCRTTPSEVGTVEDAKGPGDDGSLVRLPEDQH